MIDFENYERVTVRHEDGSHSFMYDYNATTPPIKTLLDRLAELEDRIEDGTLVFIDEPFYAKGHQCYGVYQKNGDIVQTLFTTEEQAKNYKNNRALYCGKENKK